MDQELIAYLEARFGGLERQIADLREETRSVREEAATTSRQIADLREETTTTSRGLAQQIADLREETTTTSRGLAQQIADLREETRTSSRQTHVLLEALRSDLRMVAEGVMGTAETLAAFKAEVNRRFNDLEQRIGAPFYRELSEKVYRLEEWAEMKNQDAIEAVRKRFGKPQSQA